MKQPKAQESRILIQNSLKKVQGRDFQVQSRDPSLVLESIKMGRKFTKCSSQLEDLIHCNYTLIVYI
jgi:2C-methyl-D-erythritol 2,4-cyclodiphosphate synthase